MRICYLANANMIHVQRWIKYFAERGHEVHIISFEPSDIELNGINTHIIKTNKRYLYISFPYKFLQIRTIVKDIKPDIVHALDITKHSNIAPFLGFSPFVATALGSDILINAKKSKIFKKSAQLSLKRADCITCDGSNLREALIKLGAEPQKIRRIYWGTDTRKFNPEQRSEKIREDLGISNSPTIISSKNLEPVYDIESLVRSIPFVLKKAPEARFVIAGRGHQEAELKQLAKSLGVSDRVKFIGFIPSDEYPKYLASADIYVCTSLSDGGLAISTKEAMACELPVIVTDFGDNGKWIEDGENGFVVPLNDPKALAEKIICLLENEDVRMKFGERGRRMVKDRFEYDKELKKVENLYEQLIREHKK